jgi:hypothetical protein
LSRKRFLDKQIRHRPIQISIIQQKVLESFGLGLLIKD